MGKKIGNLTEGAVKTATKAETKATKEVVKATNKFNKATDGGRNMTSSAVNKLEKAKGGAQVARGNTVRAQMTNSATKGVPGQVVNKATQNSVTDKVKSFFGF